ncbi:MAG: VacJ family lipoprotein [Lentisphaeria bacterium]|nr:VacJ family lipoprotein [Lentisphaeria bacterium]
MMAGVPDYRRGTGVLILAAGLLLGCPGPGMRAADDDMAGFDEEMEARAVADPIEPVNRGLYQVNDRLYFWVLKPLATGYARILPESVREGVANVFRNAAMPRRAVNCLLQGRTSDLLDELSRFLVNTTAGVGGYLDLAETVFEIEEHDEDFGQTLGRYGLGHGPYLTLPALGPSSCRDGAGLVADAFLDPLNYIGESGLRLGIRACDRINHTSLRLGDYEKSKEVAIDHYISLRESYIQYRDRQAAE